MAEIILVEKDWTTCALIKAQLEEKGYQVKGIKTVDELIAWLKTIIRRPALILLDTSGQELTEETIRELQRRGEELPIVICTGPYDLAKFNFGRRGFKNLLVRPFPIRDIVTMVNKILGVEP